MPSETQDLNSRTKHFHFFGPPGVLFISLSVPAVIYGLYFGCSEGAGCSAPNALGLGFRALLRPASLWDWQATLIYLAWYAYCVVAWAVLPGQWVQGTLLRDGTRKAYKMNGFATFLLTMGMTALWILFFGTQSFTFIYKRYVGLVTAAISMSLFQAAACYISSFYGNKLLALGGNTGNALYDFFIGRELNPSIGALDLSSFNEVRPGLILWVLINISMACEQSIRLGGHITDSMALVVLFQGLYVADCLYNEPAILTTMDVTTDGFGLMLAYGDLAWVPFTYSLQARYLVFAPRHLGLLKSLLITAVNFLGYWIFRDANGEKDAFRKGRNPKNLKYMETKRGTKLLISGWWGLCRHPNYLGDLLMALAWSLPTGFDAPLTYFYVAYFTVLLIHRQRRDDEHCAEKYGDDWQVYMKHVPYRIVPYIY